MTETLDPVAEEMEPQRLAEQLLAQANEERDRPGRSGPAAQLADEERARSWTTTVEIRRVICSTNAVGRCPLPGAAIRARGRFPTEQAALKRL